MRTRHRQDAFSLIELLLVVFMLALLAGTVVANFSGRSTAAQLDTEVRRISGLMRSARAMALTEGVITVVSLNATSDGITAVPSGDSLELGEAYSIALSPGAALPTDRKSGIYFYPDGSASGGRFVVSSAAGSRLVDVNWLTGTIEIARNNGS